MSDLTPAEKRCRDCGEVKPASEFWRRKQSPDGLALYCRECFGLRNAAEYRKKQAAIGKVARAYRRQSAVPEGMKYCARCEQIKSIEEFGSNRSDPSGRTTYCRPCHNRVMAELKAKKHGSVRSHHLKRRYGLTEEEVEALRGLGQFKDDPQVMRAAVDYLEGRLGEPMPPQRRARRDWGTLKSRRHYRLTGRYGIGEDHVERLIERQGGVCPICRKAPLTAVDHDHVTGFVWGVCCPDCNTGMGQLRDDPWVIRRAIEYLAGGLSGLRRTDDGRFEVTVVRPSGAAPKVDPGWDAGNIGGHDLALLHALAYGDSGDPWETDVDLVGRETPARPPYPVLDLSDPADDAPRPGEPPAHEPPPDPVVYALS